MPTGSRTTRGAWLACALLLSPLAGCDCGGGDPLDTFSPDLRWAPAELSFGALPLGASGTRQITFINDGNAPAELEGELSLDAPPEAGFTIVSVSPTFPVPGGGITDVVVRFAPSAERTFEGVLALPFRTPTGRVEIPLSGEGLPAAVEISPAILDFGEVSAGESKSAVVTVTSRSDVTLTVPLAVEGAGFLMEGGVTTTIALEAGTSEDVEVTFAPGRGGPFEARLVAELCGDGCGPSASLSGAGLAPRIDVTPRPLDLGDVPVASEASGTLTITNVGVGTLSVTSLRILDDAGRVTLADAPELPLLLGGGESQSVEVRYLASVPEADVTASLVVESNDPLSPRVNVPIFASTPGAALRVVPSASHFGLLDAGYTRDLDVVALSSGTAPVTLTAVLIEGAGAASFTLVTPPPQLPFVLAPGESLLLTVRAAPDDDAADAGGAEASLVFTATEAPDTQSALTFASGTEGCQPRARVSSLNLGAVRVGLGSSGFLEVENVGTAPCSYQSLAPAAGLAFDAGFTWATQGLASLEPGTRGRITVGYVPSSAGTSSAFFALRFLEQPAPLFLSATGWGVLGSLVAEPPSVHFGPNVEGCPAARGVVAYVNDGAGPVVVNEMSLDPPGAAFVVDAVITPTTVPAGGTFEVGVTPLTTAAGTFLGRLIANTEESGEVIVSMTSQVEEQGAAVTETFIVEQTTPKVDVLFIVDNSYSMEDDQQVLADNFAAFIAESGTQGSVDFHIGVTTTDVISDDAARGRLVGVPKVLTASTSNLANAFAERALVGVEGHGLELGLEAMRLALSEPTLSSANGGFYRADAALSIVVVTDEDDSGDYPELDAYYPEGTRSVDGYISFLSALKGGTVSNAPVLFSSVSLFAPRYQALVETFGGVELDLDSDWGTQLGVVGAATFGLGRTFRLAATPAEGTLSVTIDGVATTAFSLDDSGRVVILDDVPPPGAEVAVTYQAECS